MRTVVAKFGGTSWPTRSSSERSARSWRPTPGRRFIVVSAPGKRYPEDVKVTDLLLGCYERAAAGESCEPTLALVHGRFREIMDGLGLDFPLEAEIARLREHLRRSPRGTMWSAGAST